MLTKCRWCTDHHACHRVDGENAGQLLYERLQTEWKAGRIGWPGIPGGRTFPWDELTEQEQTQWTRIANS